MTRKCNIWNRPQLTTTAALLAVTAVAFVASPARALDFARREYRVEFVDGRSPLNTRGHSIFRTVHGEVIGSTRWLDRHAPGTLAGVSVSYSAITQARSWFGYQYGEPDDHIRGEALQVFVHRATQRSWLGARPYAELGTGPMWSNRRVPAATSRLNFNSFLALGVSFADESRFPLRVGYRFFHVSNGGITGRNPGLNVHAVFVGTSVGKK